VPRYEHIQAIIRAWDILELVGDAPNGLSLAAIARIRQLPKPTTHNILRTLVHKGLLEKRTDPVRYVLGPLMKGLRERRVRSNRQLLAKATPIIMRLAKTLGNQVELAQYITGEVIARIRFDPVERGDLEYLYSARTPCYGTALLFQAFMQEAELAAYRVRHPLNPRDSEYWKSYELLDDFLPLIRREGYLAFAKAGVFRVAVPVFGQSADLRAMIRTSKRVSALAPGQPQEWIRLVRQAAAVLSSSIRDQDAEPTIAGIRTSPAASA